MKKSAIRIIGFICILGLSLTLFIKVFKPKYPDGLSQMSVFYEQDKNTVDVLILGTSHAFVNFNNATLWEEYGIASYNLGGSFQPFWCNYYCLKEALKYQKPELIVLEAFVATQDYEYQEDGRVIKNTYGMRWSKNKIDAIKASTPKERNIEFLLDYTQYHTRYTVLQKGDFMDDFGGNDVSYNYYDENWKGQFLFDDYCAIEREDLSWVDYATPLQSRQEEYYRKIIELAQAEDIPIAIVVAPGGFVEYEQSKINAARDIAEEYGVNFLDGNMKYDEMGLDVTCDFRDIGHMSAPGTVKFSKYIGAYLKENYNITDRRGDDRYASYDEHTAYVNQFIKDCELKKVADLNEILSYINNANYMTIVSVDGNYTSFDSNVKRVLEPLGIYDEKANGIWIIDDCNVVWKAIDEDKDDELYIRGKYRDFCVKRDSDAMQNLLIIDNVEYKKTTGGVNITVYDNATNMIVRSIGIDVDDDYAIIE